MMKLSNHDNADKPKPVKVGDILTLENIGLGKLGDGVFRHEGFVIMAPHAVSLGIRYKLKIVRIGKTIAFAEKIM